MSTTPKMHALLKETAALAAALADVGLPDTAEMMRDATAPTMIMVAAQTARHAAHGAVRVMASLTGMGALPPSGQVTEMRTMLLTIAGHSLTIEAMALDAVCDAVDAVCDAVDATIRGETMATWGWGEPCDDDANAPMPVATVTSALDATVPA